MSNSLILPCENFELWLVKITSLMQYKIIEEIREKLSKLSNRSTTVEPFQNTDSVFDFSTVLDVFWVVVVKEKFLMRPYILENFVFS